MSRQRPLMDTLPNAVGLKYKSLFLLPGTYACCTPQPISTPRLSLFAFSLPFRFHTSPSFPPLSLTIFGCIPLSFNSLSKSCDALHAISYLFTSLSPASVCQPVSNCVFPLHLAISLVSFPLPSAYSMHFSWHPHFYLLLHFPLFVPVSILSNSPFMYFTFQSLPVLKWV